MPAPFTVAVAPGPLVSTAIHAGHDLRPSTARLMALDERTRRREEDPFTDRFLGEVGVRITVHRSRFEVDLNRPRDGAVYVDPGDAWGLDVWTEPLPASEQEASRRLHDDFYRMLREHLDRQAAAGPFLLLDVHSYNHRRDGPHAPAAPIVDNPEVNVGTGALDRRRWGPAIDCFVDTLGAQHVDDGETEPHDLDVRENVKFRGGHLSRWVAAHYPSTGCVLAIEFKKVFMDEWSDCYDDRHVAFLRDGLDTAARRTLERLDAEVA